jgi:hypothetical protein
LMATRRYASGIPPRRNGIGNSSVKPKPPKLGDTSCPSGVGGSIARIHIDSQSGGNDSVEVCPLRINEKAPTKSRGCHYLGWQYVVRVRNGRRISTTACVPELCTMSQTAANHTSCCCPRHMASADATSVRLPADGHPRSIGVRWFSGCTSVLALCPPPCPAERVRDCDVDGKR